jgi:hypothetical protein
MKDRTARYLHGHDIHPVQPQRTTARSRAQRDPHCPDRSRGVRFAFIAHRISPRRKQEIPAANRRKTDRAEAAAERHGGRLGSSHARQPTYDPMVRLTVMRDGRHVSTLSMSTRRILESSPIARYDVPQR